MVESGRQVYRDYWIEKTTRDAPKRIKMDFVTLRIMYLSNFVILNLRGFNLIVDAPSTWLRA
jgi:hypothetical protein